MNDVSTPPRSPVRSVRSASPDQHDPPVPDPIAGIVRFEDTPATEAVVSWTTTVPGSRHVVHFDTEPRDGEVEAYASHSTPVVSAA